MQNPTEYYDMVDLGLPPATNFLRGILWMPFGGSSTVSSAVCPRVPGLFLMGKFTDWEVISRDDL
jgi:hypothetical protein